MYHRFKILSYTTGLIIGTNLISAAHAINPISGWYGGVFLGPSYAPTTNFTLAVPNYFSEQKGSLSYSVLGDVGGEIGYRFCDRYRLEGELFYNNSPYNQLSFYALTPANQAQLTNRFPNITLPNQGFTINSSTTAQGLTMQGQTNTAAFMFNAYYDFLSPSEDNYSKIAPFVGVGVGYVYVQNYINFYYSGTQLQHFQLTDSFQTAAGQAIVGSNYFLDDFTTLGIDFRFFSSAKTSQSGVLKYNNPLNRDSFYSINLAFNGSFDGG